MSIKNKIIIPSVAISVLICVITAILFCNVMKRELIAVGAQDALYVANKAAADIDGSIVATLDVGKEESAAYRRITAAFEDAAEGAMVAAMHTIYTDGENVYYGVSTLEDRPLIGDAYEDNGDKLQRVFAGETIAGDAVRTKGDKSVITSYVPVINKTGEIVGAIACDYDAASIMQAISKTVQNTIFIGGGCILLAVLLITFIARKVIDNLKTVDGKLLDIVNDHGDLTQTITIHTKDETREIAEHVNDLLRYMRQIMTHISGNSKQLSVSSEIVAQNLKSTESQLSGVTGVMQQMSAAMEETSASLSGIDGLTKQINAAIREIAESSEEGVIMTDEISKSAQQIKERAVSEREETLGYFEELSRRVGEKIEQSKTVESISTLTDEILAMTNQTNLLSLNASIEAARAGEAGRGFAVVAMEIGKLAADSASAATKIEQVSRNVIVAVEDLAKQAQEMIDYVNDTTVKCYEKLVDACGDYSNDSAKISSMMQRFKNQALSLQENMDTISNAVTEVNIAVEESTNGIYSISETAINISGNVTDIQVEADKNLEIAGQLQSEVDKFKI